LRKTVERQNQFKNPKSICMIRLFTKATKCALVLLLAANMGWAQGKNVTGKVTSSDDGSPLPGVNILEVGTSNGTVTDGDGNFTIQVGASATLSVSFIGYRTQQVSVGAQTAIAIVLETDVTALQEVVVVGYGEVQKKDATGAVTAISNKDFNKGVLTSPQDLLVGKFAGVAITSNSGAPGSGSTIRIRGGGSLNASNDPLIVIDGFPVDNIPSSGVGSMGGVPNPLASLNPNDIETFTVLKDASATAIYGSRASNGVIIVTTKKGAEGKTKFNYNGNTSVGSPIKYVDVLNAEQYKSLVNTLGQTGVAGIDASAIAKLGNANTDWQKEIFRDAVSHDHNLSVSGSLKRMPYRISYGYTDQQGILKTTGIQRNSLNINVNPTLLNGDLKLNLSAKGSYTTSNFGETGAVGNAVAFDPTQPVYDEAATQYGGYFSWLSKGAISGTANPVAQLSQTDNQSTSNRIIANFQAEYKLRFFPDIKINVNAGIDRVVSDGFHRVPLTAAFENNGIAAPGTQLVGKDNTYGGRNQSELLDIYANYLKQFGQHKLDITAGYGWQHFYRDAYSVNTSIARTVSNPSRSQNYLVSFFGRLNYTYNGKYLLTATLRDDGSSRFGSSNKWGLFPSVALAWRMKDESFLSDVNILSDLKLRAGYGVTGQQDVLGQYFPYLAVYQASDTQTQYQLGYNADGSPKFYTTLRPNPYDPNIKWESTATYNLGVDFGFFDDKVTGSVEVFQKNTTDLLNTVTIPNGVNFSNTLTTNVGSMENQGLEITLKAMPIATRDFTWNIGANFTGITSKITKLNLTDDPAYLGVFVGGIGVNANIQNHQVGYPAFSFFPYQQVYGAAGNPIEGLYVDRSGQGGSVVGSNLNKYRYKRPVPDFLIGINSRVSYKKLDFSFSGRLSIGNYVYNNVESGRAFYNGVYALGHFRNTLNSINDTQFVNQQIYSDFYVQNASFFKMDNVSLGYTLDKLFVEKLKVRLSLTVQNAFIITKYKGIDPEVDGGIDNNIYPRPRTILLGLNVTF
jgi:TonB-dependent starch-binding outer membrane protein SusC